MDDRTSAELTALRARAYGPGDGLVDDRAALDRLAQLEELSLVERAPTPPRSEEPHPPEAAGQPVRGADPEVSIDGVLVGGDAEEEAAEPRPPLIWWTRRRIAAVGALGLVAVIVAVAAITAAFTYRLQADPREIAVLQIDPGAEWPQMMGDRRDGGEIFEEFYGLRALIQTQAPSFSAVEVCMSLIEGSVVTGRSSYSNFYIGACGAGEFPATVSMLVNSTAPDELQERFPAGTSLQFILRGDELAVLSSPPAPAVLDEAADAG